MSSLLTNMSAMSALANLAMTQKNLSMVQSQISSGLKVANASDNAAYWSISTTMKSDTTALTAVSDALNLGSSTLGVANSALTSSINVLNSIKKDLVAAQEPGIDKTKIQTDISALLKQLKSQSDSASFSGANLLSVNSDQTTFNNVKSVVASFSRDSDGGVSVGTISIDTNGIKLYDAASAATGYTTAAATNAAAAVTAYDSYKTAAATAAASGSAADITASDTAKQAYTDALTALAQTDNGLGAGSYGAGLLDQTRVNGDTTLSGGIAALDISALTDSATDVQTLSDYVSMVDSAILDVTNAASTLGADKARIDVQSTFVTALSDAITSGVGSLVDADMNEASTRLQALQTQQQLGIQSLSIANQQTQLILKLFNG